MKERNYLNKKENGNLSSVSLTRYLLWEELGATFLLRTFQCIDLEEYLPP